jgi:hypothetical protein
MKILGKTVSGTFQSFYKSIANKLDIPIQFESDPFQAMGDYRLDNGIAKDQAENQYA